MFQEKQVKSNSLDTSISRSVYYDRARRNGCILSFPWVGKSRIIGLWSREFDPIKAVVSMIHHKKNYLKLCFKFEINKPTFYIRKSKVVDHCVWNPSDWARFPLRSRRLEFVQINLEFAISSQTPELINIYQPLVGINSEILVGSSRRIGRLC